MENEPFPESDLKSDFDCTNNLVLSVQGSREPGGCEEHGSGVRKNFCQIMKPRTPQNPASGLTKIALKLGTLDKSFCVPVVFLLRKDSVGCGVS